MGAILNWGYKVIIHNSDITYILLKVGMRGFYVINSNWKIILLWMSMLMINYSDYNNIENINILDKTAINACHLQISNYDAKS